MADFVETDGIEDDFCRELIHAVNRTPLLEKNARSLFESCHSFRNGA